MDKYFKMITLIVVLLCSFILYNSCSNNEETVYTVTFNTNGGNIIEGVNVMQGSKILRPTDPMKEGFSFAGWYTESSLTNIFDFNKPISANMTLFAKWWIGNISKNIINMVFVEGGTFTMGCTSDQGADCYPDESPSHSVTLKSFNIGKYEITQGQWKEVMGSNTSSFISCGDNCPVENISWDDIQIFITKLNQKTGKNYRLPTEAEWEYAARGGKQSNGYKYAGKNDVNSVAWYWDNSSKQTFPVGQKSPNELGLYDMSGNVMEWVNDWQGAYTISSQTDPSGPSAGSTRVLRGGSWLSYARFTRVSYRVSDYSSNKNGTYGFRVVLP